MIKLRLLPLRQYWQAAQASTDRPFADFLRVRVVCALMQAPLLLLAIAAFASSALLHLPGLARAGIVFLAIGLASIAVVQAALIRWVLHLGRWTGWKGEPIWRHEQPAHFWSRTALHALLLTIYATVAASLIWIAAFELRGSG